MAKPGYRPPRPVDKVQPGTQRGDIMPKEKLALVLEICEAIAQGGKATELMGPTRRDGWPSWSTFGSWMAQYPAVREAYRTARELSAQKLEDKALGIVDGLLAPNAEYTGTYVQAAGKAMEQLRWSAERRDPGSFGSKAEAQTVIPIQINTTLDLGQSGVLGLPPPTAKKDFSYAVEVEAEPLEGDPQPPEPVVPPNRFGITELPVSSVKRNPGGRPPGKGKHKSPAKAKEAATRYAKKGLAPETKEG